MKHNLVSVIYNSLRWAGVGTYPWPFDVYQCAICRKYLIQTTYDKIYEAIHGKLVLNSGCIGREKRD